MNLRFSKILGSPMIVGALSVVAPFGQTPRNEQQGAGGAATGTAMNYTTKRTTGITDPKAPLVFEDVTAKTALANFKHRSGTPAKDYIFEVPSGGVAVFDYDNDGLPDIYLVSRPGE